jgi:hypothetical protein
MFADAVLARKNPKFPRPGMAQSKVDYQILLMRNIDFSNVFISRDNSELCCHGAEETP